MITPQLSSATSGLTAFADKLFAFYVYNDANNSLTIGVPVYLDVRDSGEYNTKLASTAVGASSPNYGVASAGKVVLSTTAAGAGSNLTPALCVNIE